MLAIYPFAVFQELYAVIVSQTGTYFYIKNWEQSVKLIVFSQPEKKREK